MPVQIVYGGQFGHEGKGQIAYYMAKHFNAEIVMRVGDSQSLHYDPDGNSYRTLPTAHEDHVVVIPYNCHIVLEWLLEEIDKYRPKRLYIDKHTKVITEANRTEMLKSLNFNTVEPNGMGTRVVLNNRLESNKKYDCFAKYYKELEPYLTDTYNFVLAALNSGANVLIEGTRGYGLSNHLLDMIPYTMDRPIVPEVFCRDARIDTKHVNERIMCIRTFPTRSGGTRGPLPNEISWELVTALSGADSLPIDYTGFHNCRDRIALFDDSLIRRAIYETNPTIIVLSMIDYIDADCQTQLTKRVLNYVKHVESMLRVPISYVSTSKGIVIPL